jgi:opacity protein-like surface antigen
MQIFFKYITVVFVVNFLFISNSFCQEIESHHFAKSNKGGKISAPNYKSTELGVFLGVSQYNGELNPASQFNPALIHGAFGLMIRRNIHSRWAYRINGMWGKVKGNDMIFNSNINQRRSMAFASQIYEGSIQLEFNFVPYCAADNLMYFSPYIFVGAGIFKFDPQTAVSGNWENLANQQNEGVAYSKTAFAMPFGFGLKPKLSSRILLSLEWGMRKTSTDYIDDVSTTYPSGEQRGNSKNNDFYSFAGLGITIRLGPDLNSCERWGNKSMPK